MKTTPVRWTQAGHQTRASDQEHERVAGASAIGLFSSALAAQNATAARRRKELMMMAHLLPATQTSMAAATVMIIAMLNLATVMAHWGHLGVLAAHGHLVAAGLAVVRPRDDASSTAEDSEAEDTEATGYKAHA